MIDPVRDKCAERCGAVGDAPCYDVVPDWKPCRPCNEDCGIEHIEPIDANAVVAPLL